MKKIFLILLLPLFVFSSQVNYETKIYNVILSVLFPNKSTIYIWSDTTDKASILENLNNVKETKDISQADLLLINKNKKINSDKIKFVTNYQLLKNYKESAIGGFYWKKGRANILFLKQNLKKYNIVLPKSMNEYIENEL